MFGSGRSRLIQAAKMVKLRAPAAARLKMTAIMVRTRPGAEKKRLSLDGRLGELAELEVLMRLVRNGIIFWLK